MRIPCVPTGSTGHNRLGGEETRDERLQTVEAYEKLKKIVADAEEDIKKAEGGNKAAGTRARQFMQDVKAAAQEIREKILEVRDATAKPE